MEETRNGRKRSEVHFGPAADCAASCTSGQRKLLAKLAAVHADPQIRTLRRQAEMLNWSPGQGRAASRTLQPPEKLRDSRSLR